jgi:hypothetical protein
MIKNLNKTIAKLPLLKNQMIPGMILFAAIFYMFSISIRDFDGSEKLISNFEKINQNVINKPLHVNLKINSFIETDIAQGVLEFTGIILFSFDNKLTTEDEISRFTFYSSEILKKEKILDKLENDQRFIAYDIQIKIKLNLNYRLFPVDDHKVFIILMNYNFKDREIRYVNKKFDLEVNLKAYDWIMSNLIIKDGIFNSDLVFENQKINFPAILYQLEIIRYGYREILLILIPLFAVIFLTILMFAKTNVDIDYASVTFGMIALFIAYRYSIDSYMPKTSHLILADFLFLYALLLSTFSFYFRAFKSEYLQKNSIYVLALIYFVTFGLNYYLLFLW